MSNLHSRGFRLLRGAWFFAAALTCLCPHSLRAEIKIAAAGPITGQLAGMGEQMLDGARRAVADINDRGGLLGQTVELLIGDDQCDPKQAVAVANHLAARGVVFVAGHVCSSASIPAADVYQEAGIVMISAASTNPKLTEAGHSMIFRVCGRDDQQGAAAGAFIAARFKGKRVAVIHDNSAYGKGLAEAVALTLRAKGQREALYESFTAGEKDYTALIAKLKQNAIAAVFIGGYHTEAGLIARQMREQGLNAALMGGDALIVREFWPIANEAAEGAFMTFMADPRHNPAATEIVARYRQLGVEPEGYVLYTYAAVQVWAEAVRRAGAADPAKVAKTLHGGEFDTVIGRLRFDARGDVTSPAFTIYRWSKGDYAPLPD